MLKSKMYQKYFPIKDTLTRFTKEEKEILCKWVNSFDLELQTENAVRRRRAVKSGMGYCVFLTMEEYDKEVLLDMINQNCFDKKHLGILNIILYRHKYNAFLSLWLYPVLYKDELQNLLKDVAEERLL